MTAVFSSGLKIYEVINDHFTGLQSWKKVMIACGQMERETPRDLIGLFSQYQPMEAPNTDNAKCDHI